MVGGANKSDLAYQALSDMIVFQDLAPGSALSERLLMEQTGLGRTPVREALQRLARERMVDIHPSRGVFVTDVSIESYLRLLEVRRSLEELAVRLGAYRAHPSQRDAMRQLADALSRFEGDARAFGPLLKDCHALISAATGNEYLQVAIVPLQALSRRSWFANLRDTRADIHAGADHHRAILTSTADGDSDTAAKASIELNDYLVGFARRALDHPATTIPQRPSQPYAPQPDRRQDAAQIGPVDTV